jgi:hypothetical protein
MKPFCLYGLDYPFTSFTGLLDTRATLAFADFVALRFAGIDRVRRALANLCQHPPVIYLVVI